jgi:hypothetical protein
MGLGVRNGLQLYMCGRCQCGDTFPKEKDSFLFQAPMRSDRGIEEPKRQEV